MCIHDGIEPILDDIREKINWKGEKFTTEKVAEGGHVVEQNEYTELISNMYSAKLEQVKYAKAIKVAREKIRDLSA